MSIFFYMISCCCLIQKSIAQEYETVPGVFPICQQILEGLLKTIGISHDTPFLKYFSQEKLGTWMYWLPICIDVFADTSCQSAYFMDVRKQGQAINWKGWRQDDNGTCMYPKLHISSTLKTQSCIYVMYFDSFQYKQHIGCIDLVVFSSQPSELL